MSFYISESLKGRISEKDILDEVVDIKKSNFQEKLYLEIQYDDDRLCMPIISLKQNKVATILEFSVPDDTKLFRRALDVSKANKISIYLTNPLEDESDIHLFSFDNKEIELSEVRQSLLGYNYLATIVIHNCIVF